MKIDPVDYAVISQSLIAAAREMGAKLVRSAYSPIVREASDCSAALLDRHGNVVAQAELIPMQLGPISETFRACARAHPVETLGERDFYINNDPFHGGQHLPDVFLFTPVFAEGRLVGFGASVAHHLDLGGGAPGLNMAASDIYQEGLVFPPSRYHLDRDWNGGPLEALVRANIRVPDQTIGDFNAQFAANEIGALRLRELCARYSAETVEAAMAELLDYSERRVRAALAEAPDGVYEGEDAADADGLWDEPLRIKARVTIKGDSIAVDFDGTCGQVPFNLNCPASSTYSAAISCIKSVLTSADIPFNEGLKRPVTVKAPYGSILNPKPPAPVRARMTTSYRAYDAVMRALAKAVPDKVIAGGFNTTQIACLSRLGQDGYRIYLEVFGGGYGASAHGDGCDGVDSPLSNCSNIPVEAMDMDYPFFRVEGYALWEDSGGAGRHRGGRGIVRAYRILEDDVLFASYGDRFKIAPWGLFGGADGRSAECFVVRGSARIELPANGSLHLKKGDRLVLHTGGGGGYDRAGSAAHPRQ